MLLLSIVLAIVVPISYLYIIHWLDLYGSDRPRIVLLCFGWGFVAFILSFLANHFCLDILNMPLRTVGTRTAPFIEEVFKAGILVYLMRRGQLTYCVDGAVYGFASGIGFAVIENLRYIQKYPDNFFGTVVLRDFSSTLGHGTMTAMTGIALGGFVMSASGKRSKWPVLAGLAGAMTLHYLWNIFSWYSPFNRILTEWILVGVALSGLALVGATILWGLHRERLMLHESLGLKVGVSQEESSVVQHMDDLDALLDPIKRRFGASKRDQVADFLHLEARLGIKKDLDQTIEDPAIRARWTAEIAELERELDAKRRRVGVYVMLYVRSIFPETAWSLWARLGQTLAKRPDVRSSAWQPLRGRLGKPAGPGLDGIYGRMTATLTARARAALAAMHPVHELPEAMQKCFHWVLQEVHVTAEHVAAGLGHHETHAHAMLTELVERGFLHKSEVDGRAGFKARELPASEADAKPHIWQSLADRKAAPSNKDPT